MKKVIFICTLILCLLLSSCDAKVQTEQEAKASGNSSKLSMFIEIETVNEWKVVYHRDTKVMYAVSDGYYNAGTFTLLVNADGTPMVYEEDTK